MMKEITAMELKTKLDRKEDMQLIDVREEFETEVSKLDAELIPMGNILQQTDRISKDKPVIVYCKSGRRSAAIINELEKRFGFENLYNLKGGILSYAKDVDPEMEVY